MLKFLSSGTLGTHSNWAFMFVLGIVSRPPGLSNCCPNFSHMWKICLEWISPISRATALSNRCPNSVGDQEGIKGFVSDLVMIKPASGPVELLPKFCTLCSISLGIILVILGIQMIMVVHVFLKLKFCQMVPWSQRYLVCIGHCTSHELGVLS